MRSSILGIYHPGGVFHPSATYIGQFDGFGWLTAGKLTDHTEGTPVPELAEGAFSKSYIYTVAHVSGSECIVFFTCLCLCLFREIPC